MTKYVVYYRVRSFTGAKIIFAKDPEKAKLRLLELLEDGDEYTNSYLDIRDVVEFNQEQ